MLKEKPSCVLGLATGSTPLPLYRELIDREKAGRIDFSTVRSANLDEYKGLAPNHPQSYRHFMQENLFDHISIKPENTIVPDGLAENPEAMFAVYASMTLPYETLFYICKKATNRGCLSGILPPFCTPFFLLHDRT